MLIDILDNPLIKPQYKKKKEYFLLLPMYLKVKLIVVLLLEKLFTYLKKFK